MSKKDYDHFRFTEEQRNAALEYYNLQVSGRTFYEGREPRHDEVLLAMVVYQAERIATLEAKIIEDEDWETL